MMNLIPPRPVITTEIGWDNNTFTQADAARFALDAVFDGIKDGDVKTYFYALFDDGSGKFGLMNQDGTAKPAGTEFTRRAVATYPERSTGRRLALARWIADRENPLTARVAVNHVWLRHFGAPLVDDVTDFGLRSPRPRHAALLDWLAAEFVQPTWRAQFARNSFCDCVFMGAPSAGTCCGGPAGELRLYAGASSTNFSTFSGGCDA